jgi:carboxyl-terminal processing protease
MGSLPHDIPMPKSRPRALAVLLVFTVALFRASGVDDNDPKLVRWRMQRILKDVSYTVETSFYDPKLNGVDWKASVEMARQRIDKADRLGEMVAAITGLLARLNDSHTVFIPPGRTEYAVFGFDAKAFGDEVLVYDVMPKGPADAAGLQIGDRILAVNDFRATRDDIDIMLRYFRFLDPVGSLPLTISRGNSTHVVTVKAELRSEFSKDFSHLYDTYAREQKKESEFLAKNYENGVIYLRFPSFVIRPQDAGSFVAKAKDAHTVILDLRENHGGDVETLEELAGHFFHQHAKLADFVGRDRSVSVQIKPRNPYLSCPLFVLVDSHSASASEMFARYIQITHRGKTVGDHTSGRVNAARIVPGTVGSVYTAYYALEIAVGRVVMADGLGLEGRGVLPDELCIPTGDDLRSGTDRCLNRALQLAGGDLSGQQAPAPPQRN